MKKIISLVILIFLFNNVFGQNNSFGLIVNTSVYEHKEIKMPCSEGNLCTGSDEGPFFYFGIYYEQNLKNKIGLRGSLLIGQKKEGFAILSTERIDDDFIVKNTSLEINPVIKYSLGNNYDSGFYIIAGPRITFIMKTEIDKNEIKDFYKSTNLGVQVGFGINFLEYFSFEIKGFHGTTKFLDIDEKNYYVNGSASVIFKLDKLIN
jgi:hypothetical protein